jgi:hypothetical protein
MNARQRKRANAELKARIENLHSQVEGLQELIGDAEANLGHAMNGADTQGDWEAAYGEAANQVSEAEGYLSAAE